MTDWLASNLWTRVMRDAINETALRERAQVIGTGLRAIDPDLELARARAAPLTRDGFLGLADRFADQQREMADQAERHGWR